ncbi:MAG: ferritin [Gemmatimonadota bacterium]
MASSKVETALNEQINRELYAAYLYLSMMNHFEGESLSGFAHWMRLQSREEVGHAMKIVAFLHDRGGRVELQAISKPPASFDSPLAVMRTALEHERQVTAEIEGLYELALKERDFPAQVLLQWFVTEQVEEEKSASDIVDRLEIGGDSGSALLVMDERLGARSPA